MSWNKNYIYIISICIILLTISPVCGFSASRVDYIIDEQGNALVTADYTLSFVESVGLSVPNIKDELNKAIKNEYGEKAEILSVTPTRAQLSLPTFADVREGYIQTPCLSFNKIKERMDSYWFMKYLDIDYSPTITTIRFFNGDTYTYDDKMFIPSITIQT